MLASNPSAKQTSDTYFHTLEHDPFAASLIFGNHVLNQNHDSLSSIQQRVSSDQTTQMLEATQSALQSEKTCDPDTQKSLNALQLFLLKNDDWALRLNSEALIQLGQQHSVRWGLYRLLQKENRDFCLDSGLIDAGIEHTHEAVSEATEALTLPIERLIRLAHTAQSAQTMLADLSRHSERFKLAKALIEKHPALAEPLGKAWQALLETNQLPSADERSLRQVCEALKSRHKVFNSVCQASRHPKQVKRKFTSERMAKATIGFTIGLTFINPALAWLWYPVMGSTIGYFGQRALRRKVRQSWTDQTTQTPAQPGHLPRPS